MLLVMSCYRNIKVCHATVTLAYSGCVWCLLPRARCSCARGAGYSRLHSQADEAPPRCKAEPPPAEVFVAFYNEDGSSQTVGIERNLRAVDLCSLLAVKNCLPRDPRWCIVESWDEQGIERVLEDHEDVFLAFVNLRKLSNKQGKLLFRKDYHKYSFYQHPEKLCPAGVVQGAWWSAEIKALESNQACLSQQEVWPSLYSEAWIPDNRAYNWTKVFVLLHDGRIYSSPYLEVVASKLRNGSKGSQKEENCDDKEKDKCTRVSFSGVSSKDKGKSDGKSLSKGCKSAVSRLCKKTTNLPPDVAAEVMALSSSDDNGLLKFCYPAPRALCPPLGSVSMYGTRLAASLCLVTSLKPSSATSPPIISASPPSSTCTSTSTDSFGSRETCFNCQKILSSNRIDTENQLSKTGSDKNEQSDSSDVSEKRKHPKVKKNKGAKERSSRYSKLDLKSVFSRFSLEKKEKSEVSCKSIPSDEKDEKKLLKDEDDDSDHSPVSVVSCRSSEDDGEVPSTSGLSPWTSQQSSPIPEEDAVSSPTPRVTTNDLVYPRRFDNLKEISTQWLVFESEQIRDCWNFAIRMQKYGTEIRKSYQQFALRLKEMTDKDMNEPKEEKPETTVECRVAMDFTGRKGRIIDDPREAMAIQEGERRSRQDNHSGFLDPFALNNEYYTFQPWFMSDVRRDRAVSLVLKPDNKDGAFLLRNNDNGPGLVLTYKLGDKAIHNPIVEKACEAAPRRSCSLYSVDGSIFFYDLMQLIEFYQLNEGSLYCKLGDFIEDTY